MRLAGKTALITGGSAGIGRAIAQAFVREGARVVIAGRDVARGTATVQGIKAVGGEATFVQADLTSVADTQALARAATETLGQVDILVNNAGSFIFAPTEALDEAAFDTMMDTNVKGTFFLTAALAPGMAERGSGLRRIQGRRRPAYQGVGGRVWSAWGTRERHFSRAGTHRGHGGDGRRAGSACQPGAGGPPGLTGGDCRRRGIPGQR
jgi:NAD(P)-dependent dehydrogenase (short-subunit alcohol dehydrogenase family)